MVQPAGSGPGTHTGTRESAASLSSAAWVATGAMCRGWTSPWRSHCHALDQKPGGRRTTAQRGQDGAELTPATFLGKPRQRQDLE
jgi:hypothetical protein